jgi:hypothetical protein
MSRDNASMVNETRWEPRPAPQERGSAVARRGPTSWFREYIVSDAFRLLLERD